MSPAFNYALKVWITSVILSPLIMLLWSTIIDDANDVGFYVLIALFVGAIMSLPSMIILAFACNQLVNTKCKQLYKKLFLTCISAALTYLPFFILDDFKFESNSYDLVFPYCLTVILGIWLYDLPYSIN